MGDDMRTMVCRDCGAAYIGSKNSQYCESCRNRRDSDCRSRYYENVSVSAGIRKIGSQDTCQVCGKPYIIRHGTQKYCSGDCSAKARVEKQKEYQANYYKTNKKTITEKRKSSKRHTDKPTSELFPTEFSESLTAAITASGLTVKAFAEAVQIPLRAIEDWKAGRRTPPEWSQRLILKEAESLRKED